MPSRLKPLLAAAAAFLLAPAGAAQGPLPRIDGIVWQLHDASPPAEGGWHRLGAREVLIQWTAVDGTAYVPGTGLPESANMPDWARIRREPWARRVIAGLSGRFDEDRTRREIGQMTDESVRLARGQFPFRVSGYYFPAEVDPTWTDAPAVVPQLNRLPRPLWISVYDSSNIGAENLADWLASWLPGDVGIFFQDGVGVWARRAPTARHYADVLAARLGRGRVRLIAEAFRQQADGSFRPATPEELGPQLRAYRGHRIYLFDGPHYVSDETIDALLAQ
ncbi:MAG: hypothetical protein ACK4K7_02055 [Allosphingosinicella sp.]|uniref:hypothetical protein n=1 Tax=Allosphingosinicella sp. TaxID=2823234 RepID=UPI00394C690C